MLFLAVLLSMSLRCLLSVPSGVKLVGSRCVCMVGRLFVKSGLGMLGRFRVVSDGVRGAPSRCAANVDLNFLHNPAELSRLANRSLKCLDPKFA